MFPSVSNRTTPTLNWGGVKMGIHTGTCELATPGKSAKQASTSGIRKNARRKGVRFIESIAIGPVVVDLNKFIIGCVCRFIYFFLFSRRLTFLSTELSYFLFHLLLRLDCVHFLQREKIRTVSEKIKFLFSARGVRLVFWDEQGSSRPGHLRANPSRGGRGAHSTQLRAGSALPRNQIVSIRGNKEVDRAVPCPPIRTDSSVASAMLNISGIAA